MEVTCACFHPCSLKAVSVLAAVIGLGMLPGCAAPPAALPPDDAAMIAEAEAADLASMKAQNSGDLETLANYLSEDYAYLDVSGNRVDKAAMLARRAEDKRTVISETSSEDESVVLGPGVVMFRGRTDSLASYYGGLPRPSSTRYSVIWRKEADGQWRMVAAQTTDRIKREYPVKVRAEVPAGTLRAIAGAYELATRTPLTLVLEAGDGRLLATIEGQFENMDFFPEGPARFFATARPFELVLAEDGRTLTLVTFGAETTGARVMD